MTSPPYHLVESVLNNVIEEAFIGATKPNASARWLSIRQRGRRQFFSTPSSLMHQCPIAPHGRPPGYNTFSSFLAHGYADPRQKLMLLSPRPARVTLRPATGYGSPSPGWKSTAANFSDTGQTVVSPTTVLRIIALTKKKRRGFGLRANADRRRRSASPSHIAFAGIVVDQQ